MYAQVPDMEPHDSIPPSYREARESAIKANNELRNSSQTLAEEFDANFVTWKKTWSIGRMALSSSFADRCEVDEFETLVDMGPQILPLVVHELLDRSNFGVIYLYNALETDKKYLIDPDDVLNWFVLQRQANLIVDINNGREWPHWKERSI